MAAVTDVKPLEPVEATASAALAIDAVHPYRGWIWIGVFAAAASWWGVVRLGIHAVLAKLRPALDADSRLSRAAPPTSSDKAAGPLPAAHHARSALPLASPARFAPRHSSRR